MAKGEARQPGAWQPGAPSFRTSMATSPPSSRAPRGSPVAAPTSTTHLVAWDVNSPPSSSGGQSPEVRCRWGRFPREALGANPDPPPAHRGSLAAGLFLPPPGQQHSVSKPLSLSGLCCCSHMSFSDSDPLACPAEGPCGYMGPTQIPQEEPSLHRISRVPSAVQGKALRTGMGPSWGPVFCLPQASHSPLTGRGTFSRPLSLVVPRRAVGIARCRPPSVYCCPLTEPGVSSM